MTCYKNRSASFMCKSCKLSCQIGLQPNFSPWSWHITFLDFTVWLIDMNQKNAIWNGYNTKEHSNEDVWTLSLKLFPEINVPSFCVHHYSRVNIPLLIPLFPCFSISYFLEGPRLKSDNPGFVSHIFIAKMRYLKNLAKWQKMQALIKYGPEITVFWTSKYKNHCPLFKPWFSGLFTWGSFYSYVLKPSYRMFT
jgi:hypothetical protein